jgi:hypothetical protein
MEGQFLRVTDGNAAGTEIPLEEQLLIGRSAGGEGTLGGDLELSREHARVTRVGSALQIEDLGSTNGTFVNGVRISAATPIRPGDKISVGGSMIEVAGTVPPDQPTAGRPVPAPGQGTRVVGPPGGPGEGPPPAAPPPAAPPEAGPPGPPAPPPAAPPQAGPPGPPAPPPAAPPQAGPPGPPAPPPAAPPGAPQAAPPPAAGPPEGMPPGGPAAMMAKMRRRLILVGLGAFILGFAIATAVWQLL